jgi:hypothetical protein
MGMWKKLTTSQTYILMARSSLLGSGLPPLVSDNPPSSVLTLTTGVVLSRDDRDVTSSRLLLALPELLILHMKRWVKALRGRYDDTGNECEVDVASCYCMVSCQSLSKLCTDRWIRSGDKEGFNECRDGQVVPGISESGRQAVRKEKVYFLQVACLSLHLSPNGIA